MKRGAVYNSMKRFIVAVGITASVIGTSLTALADDNHRDHNWNDDYWHHERYGYWHGERGYWRNYHHKHEFIRVGPLTIEKGG
jgi:hypothetical protein